MSVNGQRLKAMWIVGIAMATLVACAGPTERTEPEGTPSGQETVMKNVDGGERSELEPLTSRVEPLDAATSARWYSGTMGDPSAPGPQTYWIDALVSFAPGHVADLADEYGAQPSDVPHDLHEPMREWTQQCAWLAADDLNRAWTSTGWSVGVWLCPEEDQALVAVVGQG